ncbi:DpnD/PcfM family protein [Enterococcus faecium]|uniref:DpnD/PcfM family protein n=2 Tax=Enterococcus TaxID=1350 RepID=UPI00256A005A|nr:DpnD/PcfM family protein [Enterococcus faecium]MDK4378004.1 DpnD/PcfM family protein [Enterococcus faecium]
MGEGRRESDVMLKEYEIEIQEVLSRVQKVEAESVGEAIDKAMALYYGQEIILDAEDMKGVDFTPITNKEGKNR